MEVVLHGFGHVQTKLAAGSFSFSRTILQIYELPSTMIPNSGSGTLRNVQRWVWRPPHQCKCSTVNSDYTIGRKDQAKADNQVLPHGTVGMQATKDLANFSMNSATCWIAKSWLSKSWQHHSYSSGFKMSAIMFSHWSQFQSANMILPLSSRSLLSLSTQLRVSFPCAQCCQMVTRFCCMQADIFHLRHLRLSFPLQSKKWRLPCP